MDFVCAQAAPENLALPVAEPFLDDLVAADRVLPNADRNISPVGDIVQIRVERAIAEVLADRGTRTPDLGGNAGTTELGAAITAAIR